MQMRFVAVLALGFLLLAGLTGCGGGSASSSADLNFNQGPVDIGPMDADAAIAADAALDAQKGVSATFLKFFNDSVNDQSWGRWSTVNNSGYKTWSLYSTSMLTPASAMRRVRAPSWPGTACFRR